MAKSRHTKTNPFRRAATQTRGAEKLDSNAAGPKPKVVYGPGVPMKGGGFAPLMELETPSLGDALKDNKTLKGSRLYGRDTRDD